MNKNILIFILCLMVCPGLAWSATCSQINLTRCLDSVCAINVSSNPAARCQYCGTSNAGTPPANSGMRSLSLGASARYTISEDELADAPTDPGQRYVWATRKCIEKIDGCTPDDVSDVYDELIEQSCRSAGVAAKMNETISTANRQTATASSCLTQIRACMVDDKRCTANYSACENDADFDRNFSECGVSATDCDEYLSEIRTSIMSSRDTAIANADALLDAIVHNYQLAREQQLASAQNACRDNSALESCIETICERSMPNKCGVGYDSERATARLLCGFYETACETLN